MNPEDIKFMQKQTQSRKKRPRRNMNIKSRIDYERGKQTLRAERLELALKKIYALVPEDSKVFIEIAKICEEAI